jgi:hypothetical protein
MKSIKFFGVLSTIFILSSCTFSINMVHTQGEASDVVDENQSAEPDISPTISIPSEVL